MCVCMHVHVCECVLASVCVCVCMCARMNACSYICICVVKGQLMPLFMVAIFLTYWVTLPASEAHLLIDLPSALALVKSFMYKYVLR